MTSTSTSSTSATPASTTPASMFGSNLFNSDLFAPQLASQSNSAFQNPNLGGNSRQLRIDQMFQTAPNRSTLSGTSQSTNLTQPKEEPGQLPWPLQSNPYWSKIYLESSNIFLRLKDHVKEDSLSKNCHIFKKLSIFRDEIFRNGIHLLNCVITWLDHGSALSTCHNIPFTKKIKKCLFITPSSLNPLFAIMSACNGQYGLLGRPKDRTVADQIHIFWKFKIIVLSKLRIILPGYNSIK